MRVKSHIRSDISVWGRGTTEESQEHANNLEFPCTSSTRRGSTTDEARHEIVKLFVKCLSSDRQANSGNIVASILEG